jgi:hypothetical protein
MPEHAGGAVPAFLWYFAGPRPIKNKAESRYGILIFTHASLVVTPGQPNKLSNQAGFAVTLVNLNGNVGKLFKIQ